MPNGVPDPTRVTVGHDNTGRDCPYCRSPLKEGEWALSCGSCRAIHHFDCWQENGAGCAVHGCASNPDPAGSRVSPTGVVAETITDQPASTGASLDAKPGKKLPAVDPEAGAAGPKAEAAGPEAGAAGPKAEAAGPEAGATSSESSAAGARGRPGRWIGAALVAALLLVGATVAITLAATTPKPAHGARTIAAMTTAPKVGPNGNFVNCPAAGANLAQALANANAFNKQPTANHYDLLVDAMTELQYDLARNTDSTFKTFWAPAGKLTNGYTTDSYHAAFQRAIKAIAALTRRLCPGV